MTSKLPTLPAGWEWKKLGEIADFQGGSQPPKDQFSSIPLEGYVRLIQIRDYKSDENIIYVKKESVRRFCNETDIMIGRYGPPVFQILRGLNGAYNVALMKTVFDEKIIDKDYLYFFLQNPNIQNYIIGLSQRAAGQSGVNKDALEKYPFPLPPLDEQKRLVSLLDTLFAKIDRSIELLDENIAAADALLPSALNTVFGELEENWETKTIEDVLQIIDGDRGNNYPKKDDFFKEEYCLFLSAKNVTKNGFIFKDNQFITKEKDALLRKGRLEKNDLVLTTRGTIGNVAIFDDSVPYKIMRLNSGMVILRIFNEIILHRFLYIFLNSPSFENFLNEIQSGSAQPQISIKNLKSLKIPIPSLDIQTQTIEYLDSIRHKVEILKQVQNDKITHLKALKASILDRAFKGEL